MATCMFCGDDMRLVDDCSKNRTMDYTDGLTLDAIPYGSEGRALYGRNDDGTLIPEKRCHDCNVLVGHYHHPGCDVEECPRCHHQLISCDCRLINEVISAEQVVSKAVLNEAKQQQAEALAAALKATDELSRPAIEVGDYVRLEASSNWSENLTYLCDIQAVGVVRREAGTHGYCLMEFQSVEYAIKPHRVYQVDVDLLHTEMLEIMAEDVQAAEAVDDFDISPLVAETRAVEAALQQRIAELEAALTPFALASKDEAVDERGDNALLYVHRNSFVVIEVNEEKREFLEVRHLRAAHRVLYGTNAPRK